MLIKKRETQDTTIQELEEILEIPDLSKEIKSRAKRELRIMKSGYRGEDNAAYFIDFDYRDKKNWAIIHDLRIEHSGYVAQIDHLLIGRMLEFYVLESKNFSNGIKITERGEFLTWGYKHYYSIESPIEQNRRHIVVLKKFLQERDLLPKRLGMTMQPMFRPYVLISPKARIIRPKEQEFNTNEVIKMDEFDRQVNDDGDDMNPFVATGQVAKVISVRSLKELALNIAQHHRPQKINYYKKFGIDRTERLLSTKEKEAVPKNAKAVRNFCAKCGKTISKKVAIFCFQNKDRFGGKAYCFNCQKKI